MTQSTPFRCPRHIGAAIVLAFGASCLWANPLPIDQLPMYGGLQKTASMARADAAFVDGVLAQGLSRQQAAQTAVARGWAFWRAGDKASAMRRFNQAWLLDPKNGGAYHGFAVLVSDRDGSPIEVERLFLLAVSQPIAEATAWVDYGRFLWRQERLDESLVGLRKAIELEPKARDARSNLAFVYYLKRDAEGACSWARSAAENGDRLEAGFLEDMCRLAGKPQ